MIGTDDILAKLAAMLEAKTILKTDIAKALRIGNSRVTELFKGGRALKLDEAEVLVETFGLEEPSFQLSSPAAIPVLRLLVRHVGLELGCDQALLDQKMDSLAKDGAAFLRYASNPKVRENIELAEGFFLARDAMGSGPLAANS